MTERPGRTRAAWAAMAAAALLVVGIVALRAGDPPGEGASGSGITHAGEFYWLSDGAIRPAELGAVVAEDVQMMDFRTDLRRVGDLDPDEVLAAEVPIANGASGWRLLATDQDLGADPWSDADLAAVIEPRS